MTRRILAVLLFVLASSLWLRTACAQDSVSNLSDFATIIDQPAYVYPFEVPFETAFWPQDCWFLDLSSLTDAVAAVTNYPSQLQNGVNAWPLRLVQAADTGEMVLKYMGTATNVTLLQIAAPTNYVAFDHYNGVLGIWCIFFTGYPRTTPYTNLVADGYTFLDPPVSAMDAWGILTTDETAYFTNGVAPAGADAAGSGGGGMFMAMDDDDISCTITDETSGFGFTDIETDTNGCTLTWTSCSDHVYILQAENSLTPTSSWADIAWMWGSDGTTTYLDTNAVGQTQEFYRVVRASPDELNNGVIPYGWAVSEGLDPLDPNLPWEDPDGDGYANYTEYLNGTDPLQAETPLDVLVNQGNAYTTSLTIPIQPLSTNYPNVLMSTIPSMTNALLLSTSGGATNYTLANSEGVHYLYFQYADAEGHPHSGLIYKIVTVDRVPPYVAITSPASNAVLNQAFITLQGVVYDPDPMLTPDARPLKIWINNVPYWDRLGTNVTVNRLSVPAGTNLFTVTVQAVDQAGNTNTATSTWTVNTSGVTNAPQLSSFNISTNMLLPDVSTVWVEAAVDNSNALVNAVVTSGAGADTTNLLGVQGLQVNGSVPLTPGTNQVALVASDAAGNTSSNMFTIISSTEFSAAITNPVLDAFATAPSNMVSGYVSALVDVGMPTQTNVVGVMINGVAAVLGTNVDANGNLSFVTTNAVPVGVPITGQVLTNGDEDSSLVPLAIPPVPSLQFTVLHHEWHTDQIASAGAYLPQADASAECTFTCSQWWEVEVRQTVDDVADSSGPTDQHQMASLVNSAGHCVADPTPESLSWTVSSSSSSSCVSNSPPGCSVDLSTSAFFGTWSIDGSGNPPQRCYYTGYDDYLGYYAHVFEPYREWDRGVLTFQMPAQTDTNTTFQITFQGVDYMRASSTPRDLSQITYRGQAPATYSNNAQTVGYLVSLNGGAQYTLNQDSFTWPISAYSTILTYSDSYVTVPFAATANAHWLQWTNFVIQKLNVQLSAGNPTNVCVSYTYANPNNSDVLIANTNQVVLTAAGSPDDGTGVYTWSHSRGGTFSPNATHAATNTTYSAPELASATPAGSRDTVTVTYTYHGASASTNATLNISRPKTLQVNSQGVVISPSCTATNSTSFKTGINYTILDQFGSPLGGNGNTMATWETFSSFVVGHALIANSGSLNGLQIDTIDGFPIPGTNTLATPGPGVNTTPSLTDFFYRDYVEPGTNENFWNATTLPSPALQMNQTLIIQGAQFPTGTVVWYCDPSLGTGAILFRNLSTSTILNSGTVTSSN